MPSVPQERSGVAGCRSVFLWVSLWRSTIRLGLTEGSKGIGGLMALGYQSPVSSRDVGSAPGALPGLRRIVRCECWSSGPVTRKINDGKPATTVVRLVGITFSRLLKKTHMLRCAQSPRSNVPLRTPPFVDFSRASPLRSF